MKPKILIFFLSVLFLCFTAQAQVTRCTDPKTGRVTFTDKGCQTIAETSYERVANTSGAGIEVKSTTQGGVSYQQSSPRRITTIPNTGRCLRRCPYNGKCLQYDK